MKAFNQEKALVGAFSVIVKTGYGSGHGTASALRYQLLTRCLDIVTSGHLHMNRCWREVFQFLIRHHCMSCFVNVHINAGVMWEREKDKSHSDMLPLFMVFGRLILFRFSNRKYVPDMHTLQKQYFKMLRMKSCTSQMGRLVCKDQ